MRKSNKFPYQHMELNSLPGEKWKWIPNLEGYYKISNFGRVKRETFEITMSNGRVRPMQEKIMSAELQKGINRYIGDQVYHLRVKIMREGTCHEVSLARVVYYLFKKKFDLKDMNLLAVAQDGEGRNIKLDNLELFNRNQKQQRIHDRKRFKKPVIYSFDEFKQGMQRSANQNCRQVSTYSKTGKRIQTYLSIRAAAKALKISDSCILASLKERQVTGGGFVWRYGSKAAINLQAFIDERALRAKEIRGTKVSQFDTKGKRLNTFISIADASRLTKVGHADISSVINDKMQSAGGFIWRRGWGEKQIVVGPDSFGELLRAKMRWKPVRQFSLEGKYLKTFESVTAAAAAMQLSLSSISTALKSKSNISSGYKWKF